MQIGILIITALFGAAISTVSAQSLAIELEKMNVVYTGAVNNFTVAVSNLPDSAISVIASFGEVLHTHFGNFEWRICSRDSSMATLTIRDKVQDTIIAVRHYRVKRPPDPTPILGLRRHHGGQIGEFRSQSGIAMVLQNFDFDIKCDIVSFEMEYGKKGADLSPVVLNMGARFNEKALSFVYQATPGDSYHFFHFKYRCGCDALLRLSEDDLLFRIK